MKKLTAIEASLAFPVFSGRAGFSSDVYAKAFGVGLFGIAYAESARDSDAFVTLIREDTGEGLVSFETANLESARKLLERLPARAFLFAPLESLPGLD